MTGEWYARSPVTRQESRGFCMKTIECVCRGWRDYEMLSPALVRGLLAIR